MAGTPTPNYQFPTYAETDTPNLAGAYNQAVNAIDAKIKEVADSVSSGGDVPDATSTTKGISKLYDSATVGAGDQDDGGITPKAVADYVAAHGGTTYTAGEGIRISSDQISVAAAGYVSAPGGTPIKTTIGGVYRCTEADALDPIANDASDAGSQTWAQSAQTVPTALCLKKYVENKMAAAGAAYTGTAPIVVDNGSKTISVGNATTTAKGVVQLTNSYTPSDNTHAVTPQGVAAAFTHATTNWETLLDAATTPLTTEMLANLYVAPSGIVVYKAPTE